MNAPSVDIAAILESESELGLTFATDLFVGKEPSTPQDCVTVFDTPGQPNQLTLQQGEDYFYPSIQIRVRNKDYVTGWELARDIASQLHARAHETWNGTLYTLIQCMGEPVLLDWDENNRCRFIINFNLQRR